MDNLQGFRHVPLISDARAKEKERENQLKLDILNNPVAANKLESLAKALSENFNQSTKIMTNVRIGARVKDVINNKTYIYEYFTKPLKHDVYSKVIMDLAKKPFCEFDEEFYCILAEADILASPRYLISMLDFCKYVACGAWIIEDPNNQPEEDMLKDINKHQ